MNAIAYVQLSHPSSSTTFKNKNSLSASLLICLLMRWIDFLVLIEGVALSRFLPRYCFEYAEAGLIVAPFAIQTSVCQRTGDLWKKKKK